MIIRWQVSSITTVLVLIAMLAGCDRAEKRKARVAARAETYFRAQEYDKAKIEYLALLRLDPERSNVTALEQLGFIWLEEGVPLQAYPFFLKVRELAPENLENRARLARVLTFLGANAAAKEEAIAVLQQLPGEEDALLVLVDSVRSEEDAQEVEKQLLKIPEGNDIPYHLASAALAARTGDTAYAKSELQEALKLAPSSARAHLSMAQLYSLKQDSAKAGEEFRIAAELSPARSTARLSYAEFEKQIGNLDEATRILDEVVRQVPDYLPAWCFLAEIALSQQKFDEALSLLENVLARDPTNRDGLILQARAWLAQGETKKALEGLERLGSVYPHIPLINYHLAQAYLADGNFDSAASALDDAIGAQPDYTEAVLLRGELDVRRGTPALVVPAMLKLLKADPGLVPARVLLAKAYRASGRLDDAAATIRDQIRILTPSADAYLRLGLILREQQKTGEARDSFEHASQLAPRDLQPIEQLVDLDLSQKNFEGATLRVKQRFAKEPNSSEAQFLEGKIFASKGQWDQAEAALRAALNINPNFSRAFDLLIFTFLSIHKFDQARDELERFLSRNPDNVGAMTNLGRVYTVMKDYPKARDTYEKLLSINPGSTEAMNNLAYLYAEYLGQLDKAYELAREARALQPRDPLIADTLGWTLYKNGDYGEALRLLRESAAKTPNDLGVQFHLAMANYMMGDAGAAQKAFQKALAKNSDFSGRAEAQRRLAFLENATKLPVDQLEATLKQQPEDVLAWSRLGALYEKDGAFVKAAAAYDGALRVNSELLSAAVKLTELNAGPLQDKNMAFAFAKRARDLEPNDGRVAYLLGNVVYQLGNFPWAYSLLQESVRKIGDDPKILRDYAWTAYLLSKVSESRGLMQRLLDSHPDPKLAEEAKSFMQMSALEQEPQRLAASEQKIEKVLAADPLHVPALLAKAKVQVLRGDPKGALAIYVDVLRRYPEFALAQKYLAALYVEDPSHVEDAYGLALKARNALLDDPELAKTLGEISYKKQDFSYAIQCFQDSARNGPLRARDLYYLGMAQLRMSQDSESRTSLEKALSAGLEEPMLRDAKEAVAELHKRLSL